MKKLLVVATAVLSLTTLATSANAQSRYRGPTRVEPRASFTFSFGNSDRARFHDYYVRHRIVARPLPYGVARQIERGRPLPYGIARRPLPVELIPRYSGAYGRGVSYYIVGDGIVATRNGIVLDVMFNVFR